MQFDAQVQIMQCIAVARPNRVKALGSHFLEPAIWNFCGPMRFAALSLLSMLIPQSSKANAVVINVMCGIASVIDADVVVSAA